MENTTNQSDENEEQQNNEEPSAQQELSINQKKLDIYMESLRGEQNLQMAILGGLGAAIISAMIWAMVTVSTGYQIGLMSIAVGFIVGYAVRYSGKGIDQHFGIIGAVLALFGCLLGNLLSLIGFIAGAEGLGYMETLGLIDFGLLPEIFIETFEPMDLLFYGIAVYEGYKFSFRQITEEELLANAVD